MAPSVIVTFIRHGESTDNLRGVWAGWQDAPLSNHGMNQAHALGLFMGDTHYDIIFASDLKRAHQTSMALHSGQTANPKPPLEVSKLLREQYFGIAEGKPWLMRAESGKSLAQHFAEGKFPVLDGRLDKFPGGESLSDLRDRAEKAIETLVMPQIRKVLRDRRKGFHVAVVSHGLCISELIPALLKKQRRAEQAPSYRGLMNTAWTRLTVDAEVNGSKEGQGLEFSDDNTPALIINVTHVNQHSHIDKIKRQKGGIGNLAHDPAQRDIRAFFGGEVAAPVVAQELSESNARGEVEEAHS